MVHDVSDFGGNANDSPRSSRSSRSESRGRSSGGAPIINEYKVKFFAKRWPETLLGGMRFYGGLPWWAYVVQMSIFVVPILVCGLGVALGDSSAPFIAPVACGAAVAFFVAVLHFVNRLAQGQYDTFPSRSKGKRAASVLQDEEDIDLDEFWTPEAFNFFFGDVSTLQHLFVRLIGSFLLCAGVTHYLLPSHLSLVFGAKVSPVWWAFSALILPLSQYPLSARQPPEPNLYLSTTSSDVALLNRAFYVCICVLIDLLQYWIPSPGFHVCNQVLHVVYLFLPFLWPFGVLPQPDVFLEWMFEQMQVHLFGGSHTVSIISLVIASFLSWISVLVTWVLSMYISLQIGVAAAAVLAFLLAHDYWYRRDGWRYPRSWSFSLISSSDSSDSLLQPLVLDIIVASALLGLGIGLQFFRSQLAPALLPLDITVLFLWITYTILRHLQQPFIYGLVRNPFVPRGDGVSGLVHLSARAYIAWTRVVQAVLAVYYLLFIAGPIAYSNSSSIEASVGIALMKSVVSVRAFRWAWQCSSAALLETVVAVWIQRIGFFNPFWSDITLGGQLLILGLLRSRLVDLYEQIKFGYVLLSTLHKDKAAKNFPSWLKTIFWACSVTGAMLSICCSAFSASLLPLLGVPFFVFGFPRPRRFWHSAAQATSTSDDAQVYRHLCGPLVKSLSTAGRSGCLGDMSPGDMFLMRQEAMLLWVQVLERGLSHAYVNVKGLELQETSCHHIEAGVVSSIFAHAFEAEVVSERIREEEEETGAGDDAENPKKRSGHRARFKETRSMLNQYAKYTLQPLTTLTAPAYGISTVRLTGIIDYPANLETITSVFWKTLVWVLYHRSKKNYPIPQSWQSDFVADTRLIDSLVAEKFPLDFYYHISHMDSSASVAGTVAGEGGALNNERSSIDGGRTSTEYPVVMNAMMREDGPPGPHIEARSSPELEGEKPHVVSSTKADRNRITPVNDDPPAKRHMVGRPAMPTPAFLSDFSDSSSPGTLSSSSSSTSPLYAIPQAPTYLSAFAIEDDEDVNPKAASSSSAERKAPDQGGENDIEDLLAMLTRGGVNPKPSPPPSAADPNPPVPLAVLARQQPPPPPPSVAQLTSPPQDRTLPSSKRSSFNEKLAPLVTSKAKASSVVPVEDKIVSKGDDIPLKPVVGRKERGSRGARGASTTDNNNTNVAKGGASKKKAQQRRRDPLVHLVAQCYALVEVIGLGILSPVAAGPSHVFNVFNGKLPPSVEADFLDKETELKSLVVRAYQYAFKLVFDQAALGSDLNSMEELMGLLHEYDRDCFFGVEGTEEFQKEIATGRPMLLSLSKVDNVYMAKMLSLRDQVFQVGSLNAEAVRGLWSSLNLELLYFTNDDEERFSIQSQSYLLRNLTIQAAESPLGYSVFSSGPVRLEL
mmetsp:Transcript_28732/g.46522  ORF Transcript_28732/g.46522 Transcript_28732/m.46522 type:complete len:1392 (-) Transcript_28732:795-4970(-)|eukprot:CAMPEP_0184660558 /NCGR_PEP_ID=MMETSP0308-20130426/34365_1 /TAXON_ID=38269 /ORGANISM="Gloeochaete witrockiana, Strain SAG 46.84" /LENGTH=1391 /DNA_ID=CAMNT_0027101229 /DNA_START=135 /DNA_END=4310 /DNA_ORIENTATION=-